MKLSNILTGLLLLLVFLSITIGTSDFSWEKFFAFDQQTWLLFQESRLPRTISILLAASSMSIAGLLMQTNYPKSVCCPKHSRNDRSRQTGNGVEPLCLSVCESDPKDALCFWLIHFIYPLLPSLYDYFFFKGKEEQVKQNG